MTSPVLALRAAIRDALLADPALLALLGGPKIHDEAPASAVLPYVTFGDAEARDESTGDAGGHRHRLSLRVWSEQAGDAEALTIGGRIAELIETADLAPEGHRLIVIGVDGQEIGRPGTDGRRRMVVRISALTEPEETA